MILSLWIAAAVGFFLGWLCCAACTVRDRGWKTKPEKEIGGFEAVETLRRAGK